MLWKKDIDIELMSMSIHHIDVAVKTGTGDVEWRLTGFYGWPEVTNRHFSWKLLCELKLHFEMSWLCLGHFNEILYAHEMLGRGVRADWQKKYFREAVNKCGFREVPWLGYEFTYDNERCEEDNVQNRLDPALADNNWFDCFPLAHLFNLDQEWSDHSPLKVVFTSREGYVGFGERSFRFQ